MTETVREVSENDQLRADIYQLLAALLRRHPSPELLSFLGDLEVDANDDSDMTKAWLALKLAAVQFDSNQLEDEYFNIFLGVGSGEILPYGSWFMTGSLMDKPLALLRQDLMQLGFEREENVKEPEDHVAALCEVMSVLLLEAPAISNWPSTAAISAAGSYVSSIPCPVVPPPRFTPWWHNSAGPSLKPKSMSLNSWC